VSKKIIFTSKYDYYEKMNDPEDLYFRLDLFGLLGLIF